MTLSRLQISESGFVFDTQTGNTYSLNSTGLKVVNLLNQGKELDEIAHVLSQEFGIDEADIQKDIDDFLVTLKDNGFIHL